MKTLCSGMIRNVIFFRFQRGWSKLIMILLVSKIIIDEEKKRAWKTFHEKLLNKEFPWDRNSFSKAALLNRQRNGTVRDLISKIKNGKSAGVVTEMVKTAEEVGVEMITDIVN